MSIEPVELRAGPLRLRLADGELRYIKLGDREIARRMYFAVRTGSWDTVSPRFDVYDVQKKPDSFVVTLQAVCKGLEGVEFKWSAKIAGFANGTIEFSATGIPQVDMKSNRIGVCVLFGTPDVCKLPYTVRGSGTTKNATFPEFVNAPLMFEPNFDQIVVSGAEGWKATVKVSGEALFSMEDQRNFGDSSFKAYAPLTHDYPNIPRGLGRSETVTLSLAGAVPVAKAQSAAPTLIFGGPTTGRFPKLSAPNTDGRSFYDVNHDRDRTRDGASVSFPFTPHVHLFDDDTAWENLLALPEQVASIRKIAPGKQIDISSVTLGIGNPRPTPDPRKASPFGAAWLAAFLGEAALANVRTVGVPAPGSGHSDRVVKELFPLGGQPVSVAKLVASDLTPVVSGYQVAETRVIVNQTAIRQKVNLVGLGERSMASVELDGATAPSEFPRINKFPVDRDGKKTVTLAPYEVRFLTPTR